MSGRSIVLVLLLWSVTGCTSRRAKYGLAGGTIATGVLLVSVAPPRENCDVPDSEDELGLGCGIGQVMRGSFLTMGVAAILTGVLAVALIAGSPTQPAVGETSYLDDKIVTRLTAQAVLAARSGDCSAVRTLVDRIARRDATIVIDDPAITGCLR